ncbi:MAG: hypothetical protein HN576_02685, partial [Bacteriovoracaceae bacterium]|nr:hypothetical protein [Bacteriovoracaceae bacterium]
ADANKSLTTDAAGDPQWVATTICASGQSNRWTGTAWVCEDDDNTGGSGSVTEVTSGTGLTGGPITTTGTLNVDVGTTDGKIAQVGAGNVLPTSIIPSRSHLSALDGDPSVAVSVDSDGNTVMTGTVTATGFFYSSDRRLKENIETVGGLELIMALRGVTFDWVKDGVPDIGLIAQEVEEVLPVLVQTNDLSGLKSVKYGNLVGPLIEAIKEQQEIINHNSNLFNTMKYGLEEFQLKVSRNSRKISSLNKTIEQLQKKNQNLEARLIKLEELLLKK